MENPPNLSNLPSSIIPSQPPPMESPQPRHKKNKKDNEEALNHFILQNKEFLISYSCLHFIRNNHYFNDDKQDKIDYIEFYNDNKELIDKFEHLCYLNNTCLEEQISLLH